MISRRPRKADLRKEFINHPAVQAILEEERGVRCPREAMRRRIRRFVEEIYQDDLGDIDSALEIYASMRGLRIELTDKLRGDQDGCLVAGRILISVDRSLTRRRFTIAHEIAHTFIPETGDSTPHNWTYEWDAQSPVEQLCHVGAAELLMPYPIFEEFMESRNEDLQAVAAMQRTFGVSLEAAARHLVGLSDRRMAALIIRMMNKPADRSPSPENCELFDGPTVSPPPRLRVLTSVTSYPCGDLFIPRFKSVPDCSALYHLWENGSVEQLSTEEDWSEFPRLGWCRVSAVRLKTPPDSPDDLICMLDLQ